MKSYCDHRPIGLFLLPRRVATVPLASHWVLLSATDRDASPVWLCSQPLEEPPLYYDKKADRDESERNDPNYVIVSHRYQVLRYLPSPVQAVNVSFLVPVNVTDADGRQLRVVDVYRPVAAVEGRPLSCSIQTGYFLASVSSQAAQIR